MMWLSSLAAACGDGPCNVPTHFAAMVALPDHANLSWGESLAGLASAGLILLALWRMSRPDAAGRGLRFAMAGVALALGATLFTHNGASLPPIGLAMLFGGATGFLFAQRIVEAASSFGMLRMVALFQALASLAIMMVGAAVWMDPEACGVPYAMVGELCVDPAGGVAMRGEMAMRIAPASAIALLLGMVMGGVGLTGALVTCLRLGGGWAGAPVRLRNHRLFLAMAMLAILSLGGLQIIGHQPAPLFWSIVPLSMLVGLLLILPLGVADMPVVLVLLGSWSGWSAAVMGFAFQNVALVAIGGLAGSSCLAHGRMMNRRLSSVFANAFGMVDSSEDAVLRS